MIENNKDLIDFFWNDATKKDHHKWAFQVKGHLFPKYCKNPKYYETNPEFKKYVPKDTKEYIDIEYWRNNDLNHETYGPILIIRDFLDKNKIGHISEFPIIIDDWELWQNICRKYYVIPGPLKSDQCSAIYWKSHIRFDDLVLYLRKIFPLEYDGKKTHDHKQAPSIESNIGRKLVQRELDALDVQDDIRDEYITKRYPDLFPIVNRERNYKTGEKHNNIETKLKDLKIKIDKTKETIARLSEFYYDYLIDQYKSRNGKEIWKPSKS